MLDADLLRDAWLRFERKHGCIIDRMLCSPELRNAFLLAVNADTFGAEEQEILWALLRLRKRRSLTRSST
jgi:hypothetical protein